MQDDHTITFRLRRRWQAGCVAFLMLPSCAKALIDLYFAVSPSFNLIEAATLGLFGMLFLRRYTVQLRPEGIKLFSLWWLPWTDVVAARYTSLLGLPSLRIKRRHGFSWSIPLYFVGDCDLGDAIVRAAPPGNPLRSVSMRPAL